MAGKKYLFFFLFLFITVFSFGQQQQADSVVTVLGQLRDEQSGQPIPYAHVLNLAFKRATISDTLGFFRIPMRRSDSIVITAVGYEDTFFFLPGFWPSNHYSGVIYVKEKVYEIEGIRIHGLGSYEQFKQKVLALDLSKDRAQKMKNYYNEILTEEAIKYQRVSTGFSFSLRTPEERSLRKLGKVVAAQKIQDQIDAKFSKAIVSELTGLKGKELQKFMDFCQLPQDFILKSSEYDILIKVKSLYERYQILINQDKH
ncbi:MAG: carboxypeptidase regulatory-like domain-containing protein [Chlorobi bacterium]|nr:carboxypeptidase regulatory-like domain-containing protein [Chlorobiota bacterium]